jgi:putative ABC transport system permease protein
LALGPIGQDTQVVLYGQADTAEVRRSNPTLNYQVATPGYFSAMRISLVRGRVFDTRDDRRAPRVAIVGEATAERLWPGEDPIGKRFAMPTFTPGENQNTWRTVVGVVSDVRYRGVDSVLADVYDPALQAGATADHLVIRTHGNPSATIAAVRAVVRTRDPRAVIDGVTTMDAVVSRAIAPWRLSAWMFALFAILAFGLATVGLFSLVTLEVASRRHDFAVRLALGAVKSEIRQLVLTRAARQVVVGISLGLLVAILGTRALRGLLFGLDPLDGVTYVSVIALVISVVAVASYLPARRAAGIDPLAFLRRE